MSGARALASARRRRAEPPSAPLQSQSRNVVTSTTSTLSTEAGDSTPAKMTPAAMLLSHHKIIENLQKVVDNLNTKYGEQSSSIESIIDSKIKETALDEESKNHFRNKLDTIEANLEDMKKHTLKVQTFAMETNLQSIELKKRLNRMENGEPDKNEVAAQAIISATDKIADILIGVSQHLKEEGENQTKRQEILQDMLGNIQNSIVQNAVVEELDGDDEEETPEEGDDENGDEKPAEEKEEDEDNDEQETPEEGEDENEKPDEEGEQETPEEEQGEVENNDSDDEINFQIK